MFVAVGGLNGSSTGSVVTAVGVGAGVGDGLERWRSLSMSMSRSASWRAGGTTTVATGS